MLSIIIPTKNEEKYLPLLLDDINKQDYPCEVIVADAHSTDNTRKIATSFACKVVDGGIPGIGRNNGARAATGNYFLFLDADVRLSQHFLSSFMQQVDRKMWDLATCCIKPIKPKHIDKVLFEFTNNYIKINKYTKPAAPGFCIFCSKRLFERIGGFSDKPQMGEDHDFVTRAAKFRNLGVCSRPMIQVDLRRFEKTGRRKLAAQYTFSEICRFLGIKLDYTFFNYFDDSESLQEKLKKLLQQK